MAFNIRLPEVEEIQVWVDGFGVWGPLVFLVAFALVALTPIPVSVLAVVAGLVFGVLPGTLISVAASTVGACGAFGLSRLLGAETVSRLLGRHARKLQNRLQGNMFQAVLLLRLAPMFPYWVVNYGAGVFGVKMRPFVVATLIGGTPGLISLVAIGALIASPTWLNGVVVAVAWAAVLALSVLTFRDLRARRAAGDP